MSLLLQVIRAPGGLRDLGIAHWNRLLSETRVLRFGARLSWIIEDQGLADRCPMGVWEELCAQRYFAEATQARVRLELRRLRKALESLQTPVILLKGAAYAQSGLRVARGRDFADLDILLQRADLEAAETALATAGWVTDTHDRYDQRYYRRWMHELPPLRHRQRSLEVDLHHGLLPLTSRLRPDVELLWAASRPLAMVPFRVLCPEDMVLHSATHLFQDGEIGGDFGGLLDLHQLLSEFAKSDGFWRRLPERAEELQLGRPLYYALHFCASILNTPIPDRTLESVRRFAPGRLNGALMELLVPRVLEPRVPNRGGAIFATWLLYLRSHWLRMPPVLLIMHLLRKAVRRIRNIST